jgi:hypothetical protein
VGAAGFRSAKITMPLTQRFAQFARIGAADASRLLIGGTRFCGNQHVPGLVSRQAFDMMAALPRVSDAHGPSVGVDELKDTRCC